VFSPIQFELPAYLALGCITAVMDPPLRDEAPVVTIGARCPEAVVLTKPEPLGTWVDMFSANLLGPTSVLYVDAGSVRYYCLFNLADRETRSLMERTLARRLDVILETAAEGSPQLRFSLDNPFVRVLAEATGDGEASFEHWMESVDVVVDQLPKLFADGLQSPPDAGTRHCPVLMMPPWRVAMHLKA
jgi:hypothetical protein